VLTAFRAESPTLASLMVAREQCSDFGQQSDFIIEFGDDLLKAHEDSADKDNSFA